MIGTDFITIFTAVLLAEVCKMIIDRWLRSRINSTFDTIEKSRDKVKAYIKGGDGGAS